MEHTSSRSVQMRWRAKSQTVRKIQLRKCQIKMLAVNNCTFWLQQQWATDAHFDHGLRVGHSDNWSQISLMHHLILCAMVYDALHSPMGWPKHCQAIAITKHPTPLSLPCARCTVYSHSRQQPVKLHLSSDQQLHQISRSRVVEDNILDGQAPHMHQLFPGCFWVHRLSW